MKLKEVNDTRWEKGQPWFTRELAGLRKAMPRCEKKWLRSVSDEDCKTIRREYILCRQSYSKAVKRAKILFQTQKCHQLEAELGSPKKFWRSIKQLNISETKKKCNLMVQEVLYPEGNIRCNEEAMDLWCNHFSRLLGGADESSCGEGVIELRSQTLVYKIAWTSVAASAHLF